MSEETTKSYKLLSKHYGEDGTLYPKGAIISLTDAAAAGLVNKVELVEKPKPKPKRKPTKNPNRDEKLVPQPPILPAE